jgi:exopolysaccharide production protein ExoQ
MKWLHTTTLEECSLRLLAIWAVLAFSHPGMIPIEVSVAGGFILILLVLLTHSGAHAWCLPALPILLVLVAAASPLWAEVWAGQVFELGSKWAFGGAWAAFYGVVTLSAMIFANCATPSQGMRYLDGAFKTLVVITVVMIAALPSAAFDQRAPNIGTLAGPFTHKNILGPVLLLGLATALYANRGRTLKTLTWLCLYGTLIWMAGSASALVLAIAMLAMFLGMHSWSSSPERRTKTIILTICGTAMIAPFLIINQSTVLAAVGRDQTISGRNDIWAGTIEAWQQHPFLGYGWYIAYAEGLPASAIIHRYAGWYVPSSHDGYLSILLQLGLVGAAILVVLVATTLLKLLRMVTSNTEREVRWALQMTLIFALINFSDAHLDSTGWFILIAITTWLRIGWPQPHGQQNLPKSRSDGDLKSVAK